MVPEVERPPFIFPSQLSDKLGRAKSLNIGEAR